MTKRILIASLLLAVLAVMSISTATDAVACKKCAAHNPPKTEVKADAKPNVAPEGWTRLFDGESLVGWTVLSGKAEYDVVDGAIKGTTRKGSPNTFLCTTKEYGDFELQFEVFLHDNQLNSGVQLRSKIVNDQKGKYGGRIGGPQCEIEKGPGQSGLIYGEASGGWQSSAEKHKAQHKQFKNGQWNHYHIICKGNTIKTVINGETVEELTLKDAYHEKFKQGMIGLQVHSVGGDPNWSVSWRSIYIKELE